MKINQKKAVVTGASSGLGAAFTSDLIANGYKVYGLDRDLNKLNY